MVLERLKLPQYIAAFDDAGYDELSFLMELDEARAPWNSPRPTGPTHSFFCRRSSVA